MDVHCISAAGRRARERIHTRACARTRRHGAWNPAAASARLSSRLKRGKKNRGANSGGSARPGGQASCDQRRRRSRLANDVNQLRRARRSVNKAVERTRRENGYARVPDLAPLMHGKDSYGSDEQLVAPSIFLHFPAPEEGARSRAILDENPSI